MLSGGDIDAIYSIYMTGNDGPGSYMNFLDLLRLVRDTQLFYDQIARTDGRSFETTGSHVLVPKKG